MRHYRILSSNNEDALASDVEKALNDGWEIGGNFQVSGSGDLRRFYQPIMKVKSARGVYMSDEYQVSGLD